MARETEKYKLGYFENGDAADADIERPRWLTLDRQILGLFEVLGNGVLSGWDLITSDTSELNITVAAGSGHINYVAAETEDAVILELQPSSRNYIYAGLDVDSYWTGSVIFFVETAVSDDDELLYLGYVDTDSASAETKILAINTDGRQSLNFQDAILELVKAHRHLGGTDSPTKIDLETDVQGFLQPTNMADLDASLILRGVIDINRIPKIDHIEDLVHQGILTHAQLDTFVQLLDNVGSRLMGEVSTVNLLKLILALKHAYPTIDDYLVNELAFIPGVSPNDVVDQDATTAIVDYRTAAEGGTHTIRGTPASAAVTYTKRWDEKAEFEEAERSGTVVFGDSIMLSTLENRAFVDDFENVSDWETQVAESSEVSAAFFVDSTKKTEGDSSGKLDVGSEDAESILLLTKTFDPQDWTSYEKLVFQIYSESAEHGDIYFFLTDAVAGSQSSHQVVLERNQPTIDGQTFEIGWREIVIDVSALTRSDVTTVGFYTSTDAGWDTEAPFALNVDNMFVTSGNLFRGSGTARFVFGNEFPHLFRAVRWEASMPSGTSIKVRTRVANDEDLLETASWSSYITSSGDSISLPLAGSLYKYIQLEVLEDSDEDRKHSPQLKALMLDSTATSDEFGFVFNTSDSWKDGFLHNIDADRVEGSITIRYVGDLGTHVFGADGSVRQLNSDLSNKLVVSGTAAPRSFKQMVAQESAGFGDLVAVDFGVDGTFLVADPDNDRVLELDRDGDVVWGLMGAFPEEPTNPYDDVDDESEEDVEDEENEETASESAESSSEEATEERTLYPVGCYYSVANSRLSIMFNENVADIYESGNLDITKFVLKAGPRRVYLGEDNATAELFGIDREHSSASVTGEFFPTSSVLLVELAQADAVAINNVGEAEEPVLKISAPDINAVVASSSATIEFNVDNAEFGAEMGVRAVLDGGAPQDLYEIPEVTYTGLSDGGHTITAVLIDADGNELTWEASHTQVSFRTATGAYSDPHVTVTTPVDNQVLSSTALSVGFATVNLPANAKVKYSVDSGAAAEWTDGSPIAISGLAAGAREIKVFLTDSSDVPYGNEFASATFEVVVLNRNSVPFSLVAYQDAIKSATAVGNLETETSIETTPVEIANVRAPVDIRAVVSDRSTADAQDFDVVVAKVATPSYPNYYSEEGEGFLDGHSVVQFSKSGDVVMTVNDALIARNREEASEYFGSVEKGMGNEFLIGDAINRRAIVATVDAAARTTSVVWEYESDRIVSDFAKVPDSESEISIDENGLPKENFYVRRDTPVTWINSTSSNIRILSGSTTAEQFAADPDFGLFGSEFDSGVMAPGESYTFRFINYGTFHFFVWPFIDAGVMYVTESPVSPEDKFIVVENGPAASSYASRVVRIDAWGNAEWSFGETFLRRVKDARPVSETEVVVTV